MSAMKRNDRYGQKSVVSCISIHRHKFVDSLGTCYRGTISMHWCH
jgi:hypothetical protein